MKIQEYVEVKNHTTMRVGGQFRYFVVINNKDDLLEIFKFIEDKNLNFFIIGGGSNIVFPDGVIDGVALSINIKGFEIIKDDKSYMDIKVYSGEIWDDFVKKVVGMDLSGVEAMSYIPGTVGATPVQNVGAYGQEIKDTLLYVEAFDIKQKTIINISNEDCKFAYRDSIFKNEAKGKYIIISIILRLSKSKANIPDYPGVKKYFIENNINNPNTLDVRNAIIEIRKGKLPNPKEIANSGSFFKNPIVDKSISDKLKAMFDDLNVFKVDESHTKIPAGWLIEKAGLKGKDFGKVSVYSNNALVLINNGGATCQELKDVKNKIIDIVFEKFNIRLESEPEFID